MATEGAKRAQNRQHLEAFRPFLPDECNTGMLFRICSNYQVENRLKKCINN